jgi:hypothetical protein
MNEIKKDDMKWGIFLRLSVAKETLDIINVYEKAIPKIIRKWKDKYSLKEYAGVLERSKEGFIHVHLYINFISLNLQYLLIHITVYLFLLIF